MSIVLYVLGVLLMAATCYGIYENTGKEPRLLKVIPLCIFWPALVIAGLIRVIHKGIRHVFTTN